MKIRFSLLVCLGVSFAYGSIIRDVAIHSPSMDKDVPASVILPDSYDVDKATRWPVIYVLHGAGGTHRRYIDVNLGVPDLADRFQVILVCADGGKTSWCFDSPFKTYFNTGCGRIL